MKRILMAAAAVATSFVALADRTATETWVGTMVTNSMNEAISHADVSDAILQAQINVESQTREASDTTLARLASAQATNVTTQVKLLNDRLDLEVTARQTADTTINKTVVQVQSDIVAVNETIDIINTSVSTVKSDLATVSSAVAKKADAPATGTSYATEAWVNAQGFLKSEGGGISGDIASKEWVQAQGYLSTAILDNYATMAWVNSQGFIGTAGLANYVKNTDLTTTLANYATTTSVTESLKSYAKSDSVPATTDFNNAITDINKAINDEKTARETGDTNMEATLTAKLPNLVDTSVTDNQRRTSTWVACTNVLSWSDHPTRFTVQNTNVMCDGDWPTGKPVFVYFDPVDGNYNPTNMKILGYGSWPTTAFQAVVWYVDTKGAYYVNILSTFE